MSPGRRWDHCSGSRRKENVRKTIGCRRCWDVWDVWDVCQRSIEDETVGLRLLALRYRGGACERPKRPTAAHGPRADRERWSRQTSHRTSLSRPAWDLGRQTSALPAQPQSQLKRGNLSMAAMPPLHRPKGAVTRAEGRRQYDQRRGSPRARGYDAEWDRAARAYRQENPFCEYCDAGAFGPPRTEPSTCVDHLYPQKGDRDLFWKREWWVAACDSCHAGPKQSVETMPPETLHRLARLLRRPVLETYSPEVKQRRNLTATRAPNPGLMSRPTWFVRTTVPLTVVCGPPGAGKSTYVCEHARRSDRIICFDDLAAARFGRPGLKRTAAKLSAEQVADVLRDRNHALGDLMRDHAARRWTGAWLILSEPDAEHRTWWADTTGARVLVLPTPAEECIRRIALDAARGDIRGDDAAAVAVAWHAAFRPAACDVVVPWG